MNLSWPSIKNWLTLAGSTFLGAAQGYLFTHLGPSLPNNKQQWEAILGGAAVAGAAAVYHLYQDKPQKPGS